MPDPINHPPHYTHGSIECIVKYVCRAGHKGEELEDLRKAAWYLQRRIEQLEGEASSSRDV